MVGISLKAELRADFSNCIGLAFLCFTGRTQPLLSSAHHSDFG